MSEINLVYNPKATDTIQRMKDIAYNEYNIRFNEIIDDTKLTLYYGVSDFNLSKLAQAQYFEDIIPNTLLSLENYEVISDYDLVIMKNPTRLLLWKDAKHISGSKYLYIKDKEEWRINYSYGKVRGVMNKNVGDNVFGKANISQWTPETREDIRNYLIVVTKQIAEKIENAGYNLKNFGLDIIRDKRTGEFLFLELNQANSLNDNQIRFFLQGYLAFTNNFIKIDEFLSSLSREQLDYLRQKLRPEDKDILGLDLDD